MYKRPRVSASLFPCHLSYAPHTTASATCPPVPSYLHIYTSSATTETRFNLTTEGDDMPSKRNKQKLLQDELAGPQSQSVLRDDIKETWTVNLEDVRKHVECPICLGIIRKTRAVMECMHRFCKDCIEKSFRLGNNECPACREHCSSRRSLREDPKYDNVISLLFPDIDQYEEEELAISNDVIKSLESMRKSYSMTFKRQRAALGKKRAAAAFMKGPIVKYLRSSTLKRSLGNATTETGGSSSNRERALSHIAEERETKVIPKSDTSEAETEAQSDANVEEIQSPQQHVVTNAVVIEDGTTSEGNVPQTEPIRDIISSSATLVWGRNGQRSNTRNNARYVAAANRSNRLARLIEHLRASEQNDEELDIFIKLVSFEEKRVPNLPRPYISCRPTLSMKQLCEYVANETSLQTEEIELYIVKECQPNIVNGDGKLDPDKDRTQFLAREEETLAELRANNYFSFGHLVIAYNRKRWDLNEVLSFE